MRVYKPPTTDGLPTVATIRRRIQKKSTAKEAYNLVKVRGKVNQFYVTLNGLQLNRPTDLRSICRYMEVAR